MDFGDVTIAQLADLGTSVILIIACAALWRRLNKVTDDIIAVKTAVETVKASMAPEQQAAPTPLEPPPRAEIPRGM